MQFWITLIWVIAGVLVALGLVKIYWRHIVEKVRRWSGDEKGEDGQAGMPVLRAAEPAKAEEEKIPPGPHSRASDLGQTVRGYAQRQKLASGKISLVFAEQELAKTLGDESYRVRDILEHLEKQGHARKSGVPGCWTIS